MWSGAGAMTEPRFPASQVRKFMRADERLEYLDLEDKRRALQLELAGVLARQTTIRRRIRNRMAKNSG